MATIISQLDQLCRIRSLAPKAVDSSSLTWQILAEKEIDGAMADQAAISFLVTHHASASGGLGFITAAMDDSLFQNLADLEKNLRGAKPRGSKVWKLLRQIGQRTAERIGEDGCLMLIHARSITAFSNYPIGLAILPGDTSPLSCRAPVVYRPILPLTRAMQMELERRHVYDFGNRLKVLIAECVPQHDRIGSISRKAWSSVSARVRDIPGAECQFAEIGEPSELNQLLREGFHILILSAHGCYDEVRNIAGISCGGKVLLGPELEIGKVPPLVILSACSVAPRGNGLVSIADNLLRQGAIAVLGTLVPVDVIHNELVMIRLFVYIRETLEGRRPFRTFADIWQFVSSSNAVNDILFSNASIASWSSGSKIEDSPVRQFMLEKSRGRLRGGHMYSDSVTVLSEIAREQGIGSKFEAWMRDRGFIPSTLFYTMIGWPENLVFNDETIEKFRKKELSP